jgi:hypothetical protein
MQRLVLPMEACVLRYPLPWLTLVVDSTLATTAVRSSGIRPSAITQRRRCGPVRGAAKSSRVCIGRLRSLHVFVSAQAAQGAIA